jgi:hypothetical protein
MTWKTVDLGTGHRLTDNGVGDFDFVCDTLSQRQFVPVMSAVTLGGKQCACGQILRLPDGPVSVQEDRP